MKLQGSMYLAVISKLYFVMSYRRKEKMTYDSHHTVVLTNWKFCHWNKTLNVLEISICHFIN